MRFDENKLDHIWFELHDIEHRLPYGWHEQMGRVNSVRCALRDSGPMAGRLMAKRLAGIDLSTIWDILIEACKDIALYYGGSVVAGAAVGGIGGAFLGGVGAAPGAALGAAAGAQVGGWVMGFLGLKSLVVDLGRELPKALDYYSQGFRKAWGLPRHDWGHDPHHSRMDSGDSHSGASFIAQGHVIMVMAILTALTAYLTRGKGGRTVLLQEIRQSSRLGPKVADWVEQNESKLAGHPRLQTRRNAAAASPQPIMQERAPIMQERAAKSGGTGVDKSKPVSSGRDVEVNSTAADASAIRAKVLNNIADSQAARASSQFGRLSRYETAYNFYKDAGFSADRTAGHLAGIDFTQPVTLTELTPGTNYLQYPMNGKMGNYFTTVGTPAETIGINPAGRVPTLYTPTTTAPALQSTAADILDTWTVPNQPYMTKGGGTQYFVPNKGVFMQVPNP